MERNAVLSLQNILTNKRMECNPYRALHTKETIK